MRNELNAFDASFVVFNVSISALGALLSILPTFAIFVLTQFGVHGYGVNGYNPSAYSLLLIPIGLYTLWICVFWTADGIKDEENLLKRMPLLLINTLLTTPLIIFYFFIISKLVFKC